MIEKAMLDATMASQNALLRVHGILAELRRVLKPGGVLFSVSLGDRAHRRDAYNVEGLRVLDVIKLEGSYVEMDGNATNTKSAAATSSNATDAESESSDTKRTTSSNATVESPASESSDAKVATATQSSESGATVAASSGGSSSSSSGGGSGGGGGDDDDDGDDTATTKPTTPTDDSPNEKDAKSNSNNVLKRADTYLWVLRKEAADTRNMIETLASTTESDSLPVGGGAPVSSKRKP